MVCPVNNGGRRFRDGGDIYCASVSDVPAFCRKHGVNRHLRRAEKGRIAELAPATAARSVHSKAMGAIEMGLSEDELLRWSDAWRQTNPHRKILVGCRPGGHAGGTAIITRPSYGLTFSLPS